MRFKSVSVLGTSGEAQVRILSGALTRRSVVGLKRIAQIGTTLGVVLVILAGTTEVSWILPCLCWNIVAVCLWVCVKD